MTPVEAREYVLSIHPHSHEAITADQSGYVVVDGIHEGAAGQLNSNDFPSPDAAWMDAATRLQQGIQA